METYTRFEDLAGFGARRPYVTWGIFDGVHLGHQAILRALVEWARERDGLPAAITFTDHPREVLEGRRVPYLTSLAHRLRLLGRHGIAACLVLRFDLDFAATPAETFFRERLVGRMGVRGILLGAGATFGSGREGTLDRLRAWGPRSGVEVRELAPVETSAGTISSTAIRKAVEAGDLEGAAAMLGRPYSLFGTVVKGDQRGRRLGFPTANLDLPGVILPPNGVWACRTEIDGRTHDVLTNIGTRPTFSSGGTPVTVPECHVLGFDGDLYGRELEVAFRFKIREERAFAGPDALIAQIRADRAALLARPEP